MYNSSPKNTSSTSSVYPQSVISEPQEKLKPAAQNREENGFVKYSGFLITLELNLGKLSIFDISLRHITRGPSRFSKGCSNFSLQYPLGYTDIIDLQG